MLVEEKKTNDEYLIAHVENQTGRSFALLGKEPENIGSYKRGVEYDLTLDLSIGKYTNGSIVEMEIHK